MEGFCLGDPIAMESCAGIQASGQHGLAGAETAAVPLLTLTAQMAQSPERRARGCHRG